MSYSISALARFLGLPYQGDESRQVSKVSSWKEADDTALIFLDSTKKVPLPESFLAACIIAPKTLVRPGWNAIFSETPKLHFARANQLLQPRPLGHGLRHSTAVVAAGAMIGEHVDLGPACHSGRRCQDWRRLHSSRWSRCKRELQIGRTMHSVPRSDPLPLEPRSATESHYMLELLSVETALVMSSMGRGRRSSLK